MTAINILEKLKDKYHGEAYSEIVGAIAEIKAKDERIKEFMKPKSCEGCNHLIHESRLCLKKIQTHSGNLPKHFYCAYFEPKSNML